MDPKELEIIKTGDGSQSIRVPSMDETYHSLHGAVQESIYVFIEQGLEQLDKSEINVFEVGFGTGLNALLTWDFALRNNVHVFYQSIELFPIPSSIYSQYNEQWLQEHLLKDKYLQLHESDWDKRCEMDEYFEFVKLNMDWLSFQFDKPFDLIYYDAFAPSRQHEMWDIELLKKCFNALSPDGLLITYCAQGQFRRNLESVGFQAERIPGPPGKKEMIRARKRN